MSGTTTLANGQVVPSAGIIYQPAKKEKKLLVVVQYWAGDIAQAELQTNLIADLERFPNQNVDILLFGRRDAPNFQIGAVQRLQAKFGTVHQLKCRRIGATGYPYGANEMFYDLVHTMAEPRFSEKYFAFVNLESDCCPTNPGWTQQLIEAFHTAEASGKVMIGHLNERPVKHFNGVGVYSCEKTVKLFGQIAGGPAMAAYDLYHASKFLPVGQDVPEIFLDFNRPTITADELFAPRKMEKTPALFHGVKDGSAFASVRSRHVTLDKNKDLSHTTVFTFFDAVPELDANEQKKQISLWKEAWLSRGWNPVVLGPLDVMKHPKYAEYRKAFEALPTVNPKKYELLCFLRWLALDYVGGGLMVDYDVIPGRLVPSDITEIRSTADKITVLQGKSDSTSAIPSALHAKGKALKKWIETLAKYKPDEKDVEGNRTHVSDQGVLNRIIPADWIVVNPLVREVGEEGWKGAALVHFPNGAVAKYRPGATKSLLMMEFLRSA